MEIPADEPNWPPGTPLGAVDVGDVLGPDEKSPPPDQRTRLVLTRTRDTPEMRDLNAHLCEQVRLAGFKASTVAVPPVNGVFGFPGHLHGVNKEAAIVTWVENPTKLMVNEARRGATHLLPGYGFGDWCRREGVRLQASNARLASSYLPAAETTEKSAHAL